MSFWDYLNWLWNKATSVFDWFGDQYNLFKDRVANFWHYLGIIVDGVYNTVTTWITDRFNEAISFIESMGNSIRAWSDTIFQSLWNTIAWVRDWLLSQINQGIAYVIRISSDIVNYLGNQVIGWINGVIAWVSTKVEEVRSTMQSLFQPTLFIVALADKIIALTSDNIFAKLLHLAQDGYKELVLFIDNPTGYVLDRIESKALDFIGDVIGHSMGAEKADLPDKIRWLK